MDPDSKLEKLKELSAEYEECDRCQLCDPVGRTRRNVVFGEGSSNAKIVLVGEAPGEQEDLSGVPFHPDAAAGGLFQKFLESLSSSRDEVFVTNSVCCRPTLDEDPAKNRFPTMDEVKACMPRLHRTIEIIDPIVVLLLGKYALKSLSAEKKGIQYLTRQVEDLKNEEIISAPRINVITQGQSLKVIRPGIACFHPSYLLRNEAETEGSDLHKAWLAWKKAFQMLDFFKERYFGDIPPDRDANE